MKSPVLFIIFKREDTTSRVFQRIREVQPPKLYIAADGPRKDKEGEAAKCEATRKIVEHIDWPCEVFRLYRDKNLGCGMGVSSAISWFFEYEEQGIILEDDILPHIDFFRYCDEMLDRYRDNHQVKCICGSNAFYEDIEHPNSYYFSHYMMVWGWATWRRTWKEYDRTLLSIPKEEFVRRVKKLPIKKGSKRMAISIYETMTSDHPIDTWDYQLVFSIWHHDGLNIIPIHNLCKNIGFGHMDAAHTTDNSGKIDAHVVQSCYPLIHPDRVVDCPKLDRITFMEMYLASPSLKDRFKQRIYRLFDSLPSWVKRAFGK